MSTEIVTSFGQQCDSSGDPESGALVYVYDVGTTTLKSVFSDTSLAIAAANPIVCDSAGRHDMRYIATGSYKIVVKDSDEVTIFTRDNIDGRVPIGSGALAIVNGGTGETTAAAARAALECASSSEVSEIAADVAALVGASGSTEATHLATGSTAQRGSAPTEGDVRRNTTTGKFEFYTGSAWVNAVTSDEVLVGSVVKSTLASYAANADLTTVIPSDDTIPQIGEGTQIISQSFTASNAANLLRFTFQGAGSRAAGNLLTVALFKGSDAPAVAATTVTITSTDDILPVSFTHEQVAGSTSAITWSVRAGNSGGTAVRFNGTSTARKLGGVMKATLLIQEIKV